MQSGVIRSSLSRKKRYLPVACSMAVLRAAATPRLRGCATMRMSLPRSWVPCRVRTKSTPASVPQSSISRNSIDPKVCANAPCMVSPM
ncbi:MAG: hypothetical protein RR711_07600 [Bacteroides sp.]